MTDNMEPRIWKHTLLQRQDEETLRELRRTAERLEKVAKRLEPKRGGAPVVALMSDDDEYSQALATFKAAAKAAEDFAEEASPRGIQVILRSMGSRRKYRALKNAHPAREGDEIDKVAGFNTETFPEALVSACLASPAMADAQREEWLDSLSDAEFNLFSMAAHQLHENLGADPKGWLLSASSQS